MGAVLEAISGVIALVTLVGLAVVGAQPEAAENDTVKAGKQAGQDDGSG